jgi:hypothetical protein
MPSRADTKVLTVGQISIGGRAWSAAKCVVAALPRPSGSSRVCHGRLSSSRRQPRAVLSAWPGTCTTNGVKPNRHISTLNLRPFAAQKWDPGARAALPPHRPPDDENLHGHRRVARTPQEFGGRSADAVAADMFVAHTTPAIPEAPVSEE